jgi:hypothetical protein
MPIHFEKRPRSKGEILSVYGTKEEFAQLATNLNERLALRDIQRTPDSTLSLPNLTSSSFYEVEFFVVSAGEAADLVRAQKRKRWVIVITWLVIVGAIICLYLLGEQKS